MGKLYLSALEARRHTLPPNDFDLFTTMNKLALMYWRNDHAKDAEVRIGILGTNHHDTLSSMHELVLAYRMLEQYKVAEKLFVLVIEAEEQV